MRHVSKPFHNPFSVLRGLRGTESDQVERADAAPEDPPSSGRVIARAVVRLERSGRKGKAVTVIEHLDLTGIEKDVWLKALKSALGCGGGIEGDSLVLQGDQRRRIGPLLSTRGVKKITIA